MLPMCEHLPQTEIFSAAHGLVKLGRGSCCDVEKLY